jgi:hypothetical protein
MGGFKRIELEEVDRAEVSSAPSPAAEESADFDRLKSEYDLLERNRKFAAVLRVARAVHDFERRLALHIDPVRAEIDWPKVEAELTRGSEEVALHWMKALWTGTVPPGSRALAMLWMTDCHIKEAIVCAIAESTFANYVLEERYRTPKAA